MIGVKQKKGLTTPVEAVLSPLVGQLTLDRTSYVAGEWVHGSLLLQAPQNTEPLNLLHVKIELTGVVYTHGAFLGSPNGPIPRDISEEFLKETYTVHTFKERFADSKQIQFNFRLKDDLITSMPKVQLKNYHEMYFGQVYYTLRAFVHTGPKKHSFPIEVGNQILTIYAEEPHRDVSYVDTVQKVKKGKVKVGIQHDTALGNGHFGNLDLHLKNESNQCIESLNVGIVEEISLYTEDYAVHMPTSNVLDTKYIYCHTVQTSELRKGEGFGFDTGTGPLELSLEIPDKTLMYPSIDIEAGKTKKEKATALIKNKDHHLKIKHYVHVSGRVSGSDKAVAVVFIKEPIKLFWRSD